MRLRILLFGGSMLCLLGLCGATAVQAQLHADDSGGVALECDGCTVRLGLDRPEDALRLRFGGGSAVLLQNPSITRSAAQEVVFAGEARSPEGIVLKIECRLTQQEDRDGVALREEFSVTPEQTLTNDVEVEIPLSLVLRRSNSKGSSGDQARPYMTSPLKNGWARSLPLPGGETRAEYRLGSSMTGNETPELALPVLHVQKPGCAAAIFADPMFSTLFSLQSVADRIEGTLRFRYSGSKVPISDRESRSFAIWVPNKRSAHTFPAAVDAWFRLMLSDVPPGPKWLHEIAMVDYDFLSDDGLGWERDLHALAGWLKPAERRRVALCLHGWYDALGSYCYDAQSRSMKQEWVAFERTRKVRFTQAELKRRLRVARELGFHVLLYFGDGMAADSGVPGYRDDWAYRDAKGNKITGWQGPDTFGPTYMLNPAHPEVFAWFTNYMAALLETYGADTEGFVWDETFHAPLGQIASAPRPAYCDRAMFALVKALTRQVHAFDPQKVFLASDCIGIRGFEHIPGYAMVADGTYQDTHCDCEAWSYGLFPNWRNTLWSCNWADVTGAHLTHWGVKNFDVPVAISNGWGDDCGPSEWSPYQRDTLLRLFRERLKQKKRVQFLTVDPSQLLARAPDRCVPGDAIPEPLPGEVNWALAANGSRISASSQDTIGSGRWPASGVIDGVRDDTGWGAGHGWASQGGETLPQWLEIDFGQERTVSRFVVITYQNDTGPGTAGKWGVQDYTIEAWDVRHQEWKRLVAESRDFPGKVRVHQLPKAARMERFRIVISRVAPLDGRARLLQVEAWGADR